VAHTGTVTDDCTGASQPYKSAQSISLGAVVTFRQVTIPLLTKGELGKAYKRLHVRPTPTSAGPATNFSGDFHASGTGPYGMNCAAKSFDTGTLTINTNPYRGSLGQAQLRGFDDLFLHGIDQAAWVFPTPTYTDNNEDTLSVQEQANTVLVQVPAEEAAVGATSVAFDGITIGDHPKQFKALLDRKTLTVKDGYYAPFGGADCQPAEPGCSVSWAFNPHAVLTRLHVYKTKRDYAK
jgi:hypothetical protein